MNTQSDAALDNELLYKLKAVLERSIADLNSAGGADIQLEHFVDAFDTQSHTIHRLMSAVVKETLAPRRPSESMSPSASLRGTSLYGSFRGGNSPAVDGSGSWMGAVRRDRIPSANVDLDHVRNLMEAIEIVSPHIVGSDVADCGSPIPEMRGGWSLPGQAGSSLSEQHTLAAAFAAPATDINPHAMRHRRTSAQPMHSAGIPIRPARSRGRGAHIDPVEFAEYAVAHMRPSARFTPMGPGFPIGSAAASEPRASLPRSFRGTHAMHLPRQDALDDMRRAPGIAQDQAHYHHLRNQGQPILSQQQSLRNQGGAISAAENASTGNSGRSSESPGMT
ncbi:hypothetical protein BX661DRAFT_81946 [Kickxella alabastrina]|uniref:uncharacterized protein n=1 Tax=Kickxella alabastrina TaxID=61397 RepID=UPI00221E957F|nr:uncharacterized protein BX661DRAFT_81946 [Kickxella alabastrina]KAI7833067.1 hypothetical protein BX661DRAFT_81946 [Kickxella alabastrina]